MRTVGIFEAKTHFSALVEDAVAGRTTIVTKNGTPVAEIVPVRGSRSRGQELAERIRSLRKQTNLGDLNVRELIDEGRRY